MRLSIITINKNNAAGLEKTIQSVVSQTYPDFEYIVIDGGGSTSNGNDMSIIKKYSQKITYWVSEPDTGIYNAMNKGIRQAKGDYCLFLNSGDWLIEDNTLQNVFAEIAEKPDGDIYYSDLLRNSGEFVTFPNILTPGYFIFNSISHQNSIIKTDLFYKHQIYNEKKIIVSDWEFFFKEIYLHKSKFVKINTKISIYLGGGLSETSGSDYDERIETIKDVFSGFDDTLLNTLLDGINWRVNSAQMAVENIKKHNGIGFKAIFFDCIPALFKRCKKIT